MIPKCRECEHCKAEPSVDEFNGDEFYAFECEKADFKWIGSGLDESDALPKTAPRWCPRRLTNRKDGK